MTAHSRREKADARRKQSVTRTANTKSKTVLKATKHNHNVTRRSSCLTTVFSLECMVKLAIVAAQYFSVRVPSSPSTAQAAKVNSPIAHLHNRFALDSRSSK